MVGMPFAGCCDRPCQCVSLTLCPSHCVVSDYCLSWLPIDPLLHCITHTQSKVVVLDVERMDRISHALQGLRMSGVTGILVFDSTGRTANWDGVVSWSSAMRSAEGTSHILSEDPEVQSEDNATIIFTSGT